jgi:hypothetical protein
MSSIYCSMCYFTLFSMGIIIIILIGIEIEENFDDSDQWYIINITIR